MVQEEETWSFLTLVVKCQQSQIFPQLDLLHQVSGEDYPLILSKFNSVFGACVHTLGTT